MPARLPRKAAPSEVAIGIVGLGFMGFTHLQAARTLRGGRVAAIVTSSPKKARGDFSDVRGNFGSGGGKVDLSGVRVHARLEDLLEDDEVDLVDICLPSHLHTSTAIGALRAGKHVMVEKPIAIVPADAKRMLAAARRARRLLLVAQVLKFFPEFRLIEDAIGDGRWGRLLALHLRRRIAKPSWGSESWFGDPRKSGGMVIDLHIHDTDFVTHLFGRPRAVSSQGLVRGGSVDFLRTTYHFRRKGGPLVTSEGGWINAPGLNFAHGYDAFFERATLHFDSSRAPQPVLYTLTGPEPVELGSLDGFAAEMQAAVEAVRTGKPSPRLSAASAAASLEVCRAEEASVRRGKMVQL